MDHVTFTNEDTGVTCAIDVDMESCHIPEGQLDALKRRSDDPSDGLCFEDMRGLLTKVMGRLMDRAGFPHRPTGKG